MAEGILGFLRTGDGIQLRYGCWTHAGDTHRGAVVVLGGRTEFMEKYLDTVRRIQARGFDVFAIDWRGQGLSSRLLPDPAKGYIGTYDQYVTDLDFFLAQVVRPHGRGPLIALAHSMGANVLLHYLARSPRGIDKGVMLAPMINIRTDPIPEAAARLWCRMMVRLGHGGKNIPSLNRRDSFNKSFAGNCLTHDRRRFDRMRRLLRDTPRLNIVGVTYGWLAATFNAIDAIRRPGLAQRITTPLLVAVAGEDRVVCNRAILQFAARLPEHEVICIAGAHHEILQELDGLQDQFWLAFDRFVGR